FHARAQSAWHWPPWPKLVADCFWVTDASSSASSRLELHGSAPRLLPSAVRRLGARHIGRHTFRHTSDFPGLHPDFDALSYACCHQWNELLRCSGIRRFGRVLAQGSLHVSGIFLCSLVEPVVNPGTVLGGL